MAFPTAVNDQTTDAVTQSSVNVLGEAPAMALGMLYQATAQALGQAAQNSVAHQQAVGVLSQAVTSRAVAALLGTAPATP